MTPPMYVYIRFRNCEACSRHTVVLSLKGVRGGIFGISWECRYGSQTCLSEKAICRGISSGTSWASPNIYGYAKMQTAEPGLFHGGCLKGNPGSFLNELPIFFNRRLFHIDEIVSGRN